MGCFFTESLFDISLTIGQIIDWMWWQRRARSARELPYSSSLIHPPDKNTQIHKYKNTQIHKYKNTEIQKYRNTKIHKYTNTKMKIQRYSSSLRDPPC